MSNLFEGKISIEEIQKIQDMPLEELNDAVARDVFCLEKTEVDYLSNISIAWEIVRFLASKMEENINFDWKGPIFKSIHCDFTGDGFPLGTTCWYVIVEDYAYKAYIFGETEMECICRAGLVAVRANRNLKKHFMLE
jgi:hypothetical protein